MFSLVFGLKSRYEMPNQATREEVNSETQQKLWLGLSYTSCIMKRKKDERPLL